MSGDVNFVWMIKCERRKLLHCCRYCSSLQGQAHKINWQERENISPALYPLGLASGYPHFLVASLLRRCVGVSPSIERFDTSIIDLIVRMVLSPKVLLEMLRATKVRIYPTAEQERHLAQSFGLGRKSLSRSQSFLP